MCNACHRSAWNQHASQVKDEVPSTLISLGRRLKPQLSFLLRKITWGVYIFLKSASGKMMQSWVSRNGNAFACNKHSSLMSKPKPRKGGSRDPYDVRRDRCKNANTHITHKNSQISYPNMRMEMSCFRMATLSTKWKSDMLSFCVRRDDCPFQKSLSQEKWDFSMHLSRCLVRMDVWDTKIPIPSSRNSWVVHTFASRDL